MGIPITGNLLCIFFLPQQEAWQFVAVTLLDVLTFPLNSIPWALQQPKLLMLHSQFLHALMTTPNSAV